jgi:hypothetical protein
MNVQELHDLLAKKYNAGGQSPLFELTFLHALQRVVVDLRGRVGLDLDTPTTLADITCDDDYYPVFMTGISLYIQDLGFFGQEKNKNDQRAEYFIELGRAHTHYFGTQTIYTGVNGVSTDDEDDE